MRVTISLHLTCFVFMRACVALFAVDGNINIPRIQNFKKSDRETSSTRMHAGSNFDLCRLVDFNRVTVSACSPLARAYMRVLVNEDRSQVHGTRSPARATIDWYYISTFFRGGVCWWWITGSWDSWKSRYFFLIFFFFWSRSNLL